MRKPEILRPGTNGAAAITTAGGRATGVLTDDSLKWTVYGDTGNYTTTVGARKLIDILRTMPSDQTVSVSGTVPTRCATSWCDGCARTRG